MVGNEVRIEGRKGGDTMKKTCGVIGVVVLAVLAVVHASIITPAEIEGIATGDDGRYKITVTKVDTVEKFVSESIVVDDGPYVVIEVVIENICEEELEISSYTFEIHSTDEDEFVWIDELTLDAQSYLGWEDRDFPVRSLSPGRRTKGELAFLPRPKIIHAALVHRGIEVTIVDFTTVPSVSWGKVKARFAR